MISSNKFYWASSNNIIIHLYQKINHEQHSHDNHHHNQCKNNSKEKLNPFYEILSTAYTRRQYIIRYIWNYDDGDDSYYYEDDDDNDDDGDDDDDKNCGGDGKCYDDYFFCGDVDDDSHHGHKDLWNICNILL